MNYCIDYKNIDNFTCLDNKNVWLVTNLAVNPDVSYQNTSDISIESAKNSNRIKHESQNMCIFNRNIAVQCQDYKDVCEEYNMLYLPYISSRKVCPPKTPNEYTSCIDFIYKPDVKLLGDLDYINCRNLPENLMCAKPMCSDDKVNDKLWNNDTKNKTKNIIKC